MTTKTCTRCRNEKPITEFGFRKDRPDGRNDMCRPCARAARQKNYIRIPEATKREMPPGRSVFKFGG